MNNSIDQGVGTGLDNAIDLWQSDEDPLALDSDIDLIREPLFSESTTSGLDALNDILCSDVTLPPTPPEPQPKRKRSDDGEGKGKAPARKKKKSRATGGPRVRNVIITLHLDDDMEDDFKFEDLYDKDLVKFMCGQLERGSDTGGLHLQAYLEFKKQVRFSTIKEMIGNDAVHIEPRKGTAKQARDYCTKEDTRVKGPWSCGTKKVAGARTDMHAVMNMAYKGKADRKIMKQFPGQFIRYHSGIKACKEVGERARRSAWRNVEVNVFYGYAGTGKSRYALDMHGQDNVYKLNKNDTLWWDGYEGEDILLIDDFYGWIPFHTLLGVLDGLKLRLPIKGAHTWANWTKVYITSNKAPDLWYPKVFSEGVPHEFTRRITNVVEFNRDGTHTEVTGVYKPNTVWQLPEEHRQVEVAPPTSSTSTSAPVEIAVNRDIASEILGSDYGSLLGSSCAASFVPGQE